MAMQEVFKRHILKLLKHSDYRPISFAELGRELGVSQKDYPDFRKAFEQLQEEGHVILGAKELATLRPLSGKIVGRFRANPKGFGFVIPREPMDGDLFVPPGNTMNAMTGDIVAAKVTKQTKGKEGQALFSGRVVEILERAGNKFVGTLQRKGTLWYVEPDGKEFSGAIYVDDVTAKSAQIKDKVVVEMLAYPSEDEPARGVIVQVLGKAGRYDSEISSVIHQFHLPMEFHEECLVQAREAARDFRPDAVSDREDITHKVIATIDPPDAKDFDDAISLEKDGKGKWVLGVHIADVSHFVGMNTHLDKEAKLRGNSVYLPGKTIPMLPEVLSNGVCSLQPEQKRFVKSAYITYDDNGKILGRRYANSVMKSTQRLTYQQANRALNGHTKDIKPEVITLLKNMNDLSRIIEQRRREDGMLHLDLPEMELVMDKAGLVVDARPADTSYPHTIIEMFMVEANEAVAVLLDRLNVSFMRRIHPDPDSLSMKNLAKIVRTFGYSLPRKPERKDLQNLLAAVKNKDSSLAINFIVLRSMERAVYSPLKIGHYALASSNYCHFTSPIRRYADLTVHRLLDDYLRNEKERELTREDLIEIGNHITFTEQQADDAENELKTVLVLQMLSKRIGEELECVVTGVTNFGAFVKSKRFGVEGLISKEDLGPDEWIYNQKTQCIYGALSGAEVRLGMGMNVKIISVNVPARQLRAAPSNPLVDRKKIERKTVKMKRREKRRERKRGRRRW